MESRLCQAYADALSGGHQEALSTAARELIETTLTDLGASNDASFEADNWLIGTMLPPRYALRYDGSFARKFFICLTTVIWKLGQRETMRLSCVAEELAAHILILEAEALLVEGGVAADFSDFRQRLFEDLDFELLYENAFDGIETGDIAETLGIANLAFADWFTRFGSPDGSAYTEVHPYAQDGDKKSSEEQ